MNHLRKKRRGQITRGRLRALAVALVLVMPAHAVSQTAPAVVLPGAVSGESNDYNLSLSADGRRMVFARSEAAFARARILMAERGPDTDAPWSTPQPISFSDERYRDSGPWLTPDGRTLYFVSDRPTAGRADRHDADIWRAVWRDGDWQAPEHLGGVVNRPGEELGPEVHDGTRYFATALRSGVGGPDIYAASPTTTGFATPRLLPVPIVGGGTTAYFRNLMVHPAAPRTGTTEQPGQIAPTAPWDAQAHISEAIAVVQRAALRSDAVDWTGLEAELRASASSAADTADLLPTYRRLLGALGDNHSFVQADQALREAYRTRYGAEFDAVQRTGSPSSTFIGRSEASVRLIALDNGAGQVALVTAPKVFGGGARATAYANTLHNSIAAAAPAACGYVVDLRGNVGGNVWPMKLGLTALLGQDYDSNDTYARIRGGAATIIAGEDAGTEILKLDNWTPLPRLEIAPVAVLIDGATGSSGEGVALAFKGRDQTRFFGQNTAGVASVTEGFTLSDGVNLVVTVEMMMDRNGAVYPHGVAPDVSVESGERSLEDPEDAVIEAAKLWLAGFVNCGA